MLALNWCQCVRIQGPGGSHLVSCQNYGAFLLGTGYPDISCITIPIRGHTVDRAPQYAPGCSRDAVGDLRKMHVAKS